MEEAPDKLTWNTQAQTEAPDLTLLENKQNPQVYLLSVARSEWEPPQSEIFRERVVVAKGQRKGGTFYVPQSMRSSFETELKSLHYNLSRIIPGGNATMKLTVTFIYKYLCTFIW